MGVGKVFLCYWVEGVKVFWLVLVCVGDGKFVVVCKVVSVGMVVFK